MNKLFLVILFSAFCCLANAGKFNWPIPYERLASRPDNDPYCQAGLVPFCPSGKTVNPLPVMDDADTIEVFALKKPVWSFKFGPLAGYFHVMHDALGFRNTRTGLNYTMEWYELDQLFNCTFPHLLQDGSLKWCNQGALCYNDGINDTIWTQYGSIDKISIVSGSLFNEFAYWATYDNNTAVFYETWTVYNTDKLDDPNLTMFFDSFDCASWTLRAVKQMYLIGAKFDTSINLNYTRLNLYGQEPKLLGNFSEVVKNTTLVADMREFYSFVQKRSDYLEQLLEIYIEFTVKKKFYFYFNGVYWFIELKAPFVKITYDRIPLPGSDD